MTQLVAYGGHGTKDDTILWCQANFVLCTCQAGPRPLHLQATRQGAGCSQQS